jgi:copper chaperone NosL
MFHRRPLILILSLMLALALFSHAWAGERKPVKPSSKDKCPVCGMFVAKYPDFVAQIIFRDGSYAAFDGAKDMFKYYFNLEKYNPSKKWKDIDSIYVTDYYSLTLVNGSGATYVIGSDVFGPMGKELISFAQETDAQEFLKDHKGQSLMNFKDVTREMIQKLDG